MELLNTSWKGDSIRLIGIRLGNFTSNRSSQLTLFDEVKNDNCDNIQKVLDNINEKFGSSSIMPASIKTCKFQGKKKKHK